MSRTFNKQQTDICLRKPQKKTLLELLQPSICLDLCINNILIPAEKNYEINAKHFQG